MTPEPKATDSIIRVSQAVLDAAGKNGDELLRALHSTREGLTHVEAEERERRIGPNVVAQEKQRGWFLRLLIILRNPLVILLAILSSISFATGDARAGSVMAGMVVLSVALRFLQEARAETAAAKLKAMIHVTATVVRDGKAREIPLRDLVPGDIINLSAGDNDPRRRAYHLREGTVREPGDSHRRVPSRRKVSRRGPQGCQISGRTYEHMLHGARTFRAALRRRS